MAYKEPEILKQFREKAQDSYRTIFKSYMTNLETQLRDYKNNYLQSYVPKYMKGITEPVLNKIKSIYNNLKEKYDLNSKKDLDYKIAINYSK